MAAIVPPFATTVPVTAESFRLTFYTFVLDACVEFGDERYAQR